MFHTGYSFYNLLADVYTTVCLTSENFILELTSIVLFYNLNFFFFQIRKHWGGGIMGSKSQARIAKMEKLKAREIAQKMG